MEDSKKIQHTEPTTALITPSASPSYSRPHSPQPHRIPDQPSPTKRPRLSSAPRQVQQRASSSSSTPVDSFDFHRAREESAMRLFGVWAGLAERHSRPLDEDDIVDIMTGKVVLDRGILRGSQTCSVGAFADPTPEDAEDELEEDEEEDEIDELDSFANPPMRDMHAPPLTDLDTRDAQDLKEFMEAEQRRREIYGSEADETEGSIYESQLEQTPVEEFDRAVSQEDSEGDQTSDEPLEPIYVDSGSEDELGGWDLKEASTVYRLPKEEDSDSEVEVLNNTTQVTLSPEIPFPLWTSPETLPRRVSNQRQLQTPPQSHSSDPSATPDDFSSQPQPTSPPRSSSPFSQYDSSPIKSRPAARGLKKPASERKRPIPAQTQLEQPSRPIPRLDLTKMSAEPSVVTQTLSTSSRAHSPNTRKQPKTMSLQPDNRTRGKLKQLASDAEIAIRRRTPFLAPSQRGNDSPKEDEIVRKPRPTAKTKGKRKAPSADIRAESDEEELPRRSSPSPASKSGPSRSQSRRPSVSSTPSASRVTEPLLDNVGSSSRKLKSSPLVTQTGSLSGKKRKRVVSSAEAVEETRTSSPEPPTEDIRRNSSTSRSRRRSDKLEIAKESSSKRREKQKHNPQQRSRSAEFGSDDASQEEEVEKGQRYSSRAPSHFNAPYYSCPLPLYSPHHPSDQQPQQPLYTPLQDPHAQYIFTQAMKQIFALSSGTWGPPPPPARCSTPFTPIHHRRHRGDPPPPPPTYSTPIHHPHPYPYSCDPMLSNATLPPSSPEVPSSPGMSAGASSRQSRRKSLVERSQSRGRRVSFREESDIDASGYLDAYSDGVDSPTRRHASGSTSKESRKKGKGMAREERPMSDSEAESEPASKPHIQKRGRATRHQTPGPRSREQEQTRDIRRVPSAHQSRNKSRAQG
ncbi:hypothetical protein C0995_000156 [Termitomyces sp. Mi166|nr:hypothetical protein C0995_000156 [Termitomyces sp. Mi166\